MVTSLFLFYYVFYMCRWCYRWCNINWLNETLLFYIYMCGSFNKFFSRVNGSLKIFRSWYLLEEKLSNFQIRFGEWTFTITFTVVNNPFLAIILFVIFGMYSRWTNWLMLSSTYLCIMKDSDVFCLRLFMIITRRLSKGFYGWTFVI